MCRKSHTGKVTQEWNGYGQGKITVDRTNSDFLDKEGEAVKQEEKKPVNWEVADPKLPVIQSGHLENKKK